MTEALTAAGVSFTGLTPDQWNEHSREFVISCDATGVVTWLDERARQRLGLEPGVRLRQLMPRGVEQKFDSFLSRALREGAKNVELPLVVKSAIATFCFNAGPDGRGGVMLLGTSLPEEYGSALIKVQQSLEEIVALNREVTRQKKQLEQTLRELDESNKGIASLHSELADNAETLHRASEVKSRVVANVSHEFRTPLHTILGLSRLLLDGVDGPLNDEQQKQLSYIRTSAEELSALVDDLLDLSVVEAGKTLLRPEKFVVKDFLAALRGMLRPLVRLPEHVELNFEDPATDIELETDHGKVAQIMRNLITNALKFTQQGSVTVAASAINGDLLLQVKDTGIGIAPEDLERIFEEFGQVEGPLQNLAKGAGLGLTISRRLAELLGGQLTVTSEVGRGSVFTLRIPRTHPEVRELSKLQKRPLDPARAPILVVEDDRKTIFMYEKYLSMAGFQVVPVRSITEAEKLLQEITPAAIVLDVMLDGEASWDFLSRLKQDPSTHDIPVLVVTVTNKEQKARALGADEFWLKPVDRDRLLRKLQTLSRSGAPTRVLVIDDDDRARYLMRKYLADGPYKLFEAASGPEGVHSARTDRPDVILLDFLLKGTTAFDALDELKADPRTRHIPVVIVTSHMLDPRDRERLSAETEVILSKESLSREIAINRIRDALRKAGAGRTIQAATEP